MRTRFVEIVLFVFAAATGFGCGRHTSVAAPTTLAAATTAAVVQAVNISGAMSGPLPVGQAVQLKAMAQMADGSFADVSVSATWTSDNAPVATVTASGLVTASRAGSATITASYQEVTGLFPITVHDADAPAPSAGTPGAQPTPPGSNPTPPGSGTRPTPPGGGSAPNPPSPPCTSPLPVTLPSPLPPCPSLPPPVGR